MSETSLSLLDLPDEIVTKMLQETDPGQVDATRQVSTQLKRIIDDNKFFESPFETYYITDDLNKMIISNAMIPDKKEKLRLFQRFGKYRLIPLDKNRSYIITESPIQKFDDYEDDEENYVKLKKVYSGLKNIDDDNKKLRAVFFDHQYFLGIVVNKKNRSFEVNKLSDKIELTIYDTGVADSGIIKHKQYSNISYRNNGGDRVFDITFDNFDYSNSFYHVHLDRHVCFIYFIDLNGIHIIEYKFNDNNLFYQNKVIKSDKIKFYNIKQDVNLVIFFEGDKIKTIEVVSKFEIPSYRQTEVNDIRLYNDRYLDIQNNYLIDLIQNKVVNNTNLEPFFTADDWELEENYGESTEDNEENEEDDEEGEENDEEGEENENRTKGIVLPKKLFEKIYKLGELKNIKLFYNDD